MKAAKRQVCKRLLDNTKILVSLSLLEQANTHSLIYLIKNFIVSIFKSIITKLSNHLFNNPQNVLLIQINSQKIPLTSNLRI